MTRGENLLQATLSELYGPYDSLDRLTTFGRGTLSSTKDAITGTPVGEQDWSLDALGNWDSVTTDSVTQTRTHNGQNQITSGGIGYDANGNMTTDQNGNTLVYDAWNRLVEVKDGATTLVRYEYDAAGDWHYRPAD